MNELVGQGPEGSDAEGRAAEAGQDPAGAVATRTRSQTQGATDAEVGDGTSGSLGEQRESDGESSLASAAESETLDLDAGLNQLRSPSHTPPPVEGVVPSFPSRTDEQVTGGSLSVGGGAPIADVDPRHLYVEGGTVLAAGGVPQVGGPDHPHSGPGGRAGPSGVGVPDPNLASGTVVRSSDPVEGGGTLSAGEPPQRTGDPVEGGGAPFAGKPRRTQRTGDSVEGGGALFADEPQRTTSLPGSGGAPLEALSMRMDAFQREMAEMRTAVLTIAEFVKVIPREPPAPPVTPAVRAPVAAKSVEYESPDTRHAPWSGLRGNSLTTLADRRTPEEKVEAALLDVQHLLEDPDANLQSGELLSALAVLGEAQCGTRRQTDPVLSMRLSEDDKTAVRNLFTGEGSGTCQQSLETLMQEVSLRAVQRTDALHMGAHALQESTPDFLAQLNFPIPVWLLSPSDDDLHPHIRQVLEILVNVPPQRMPEDLPHWNWVLKKRPAVATAHAALHRDTSRAASGDISGMDRRHAMFVTAPSASSSSYAILSLAQALGVLTPTQVRILLKRQASEFAMLEPVVSLIRSVKSLGTDFSAPSFSALAGTCSQLRELWLLPHGVSPAYASGMQLSPLEVLLRIPRPVKFAFNEAYRLHVVANQGSVKDKWMAVFQALVTFTVRPGEGSAAAQRWVQTCHAVETLCVGPDKVSRDRDYHAIIQSDYRVNAVFASLRDSYVKHRERQEITVDVPWKGFLGQLAGRLNLSVDQVYQALLDGRWPTYACPSPPLAEHKRLHFLFAALGQAQVPSDTSPASTGSSNKPPKRSGGQGRSGGRRTGAAAAAVGGEPVIHGHLKYTRYASGRGGEYRLVNVRKNDYAGGRSLVSPEAPSIFDSAAQKHLKGLTEHMQGIVERLKEKCPDRVRSYELADLVVRGLITNDLGRGRYIIIPPPEGMDPHSWDHRRGTSATKDTRNEDRADHKRASGSKSSGGGQKRQQGQKGRPGGGRSRSGGSASAAVEESSPLSQAAIDQIVEALRLSVGRDAAGASGDSASATQDAAHSVSVAGSARVGPGSRGPTSAERAVTWLAEDLEEATWDPQRSAEALFDLKPVPDARHGGSVSFGTGLDHYDAPGHGVSRGGKGHPLDAPGLAFAPETSGCVGASRPTPYPTLQSISDLLLSLSARLAVVERWVETKQPTTTASVTPAGDASGSRAQDSLHAESEPPMEASSNLLGASA